MVALIDWVAIGAALGLAVVGYGTFRFSRWLYGDVETRGSLSGPGGFCAHVGYRIVQVGAAEFVVSCGDCGASITMDVGTLCACDIIARLDTAGGARGE